MEDEEDTDEEEECDIKDISGTDISGTETLAVGVDRVVEVIVRVGVCDGGTSRRRLRSAAGAIAINNNSW